MITVLVVVTVLMTIVLSVLQVSYRYFITENGEVYRQKAREAVQSLSEELKRELTVSYTSYDEQRLGAPTEDDKPAPIWYFIRNNLGREGSGWKFEEDDVVRNHYLGNSDKFSFYNIPALEKSPSDAEGATEKVFTLEAKASDPPGDLAEVREEIPYVIVTLTWKPGKYDDNLTGTKLNVRIECKMGDYTYHVTDTYRLETGEYMKDSEDDPLNTKVTVKGVEIYKYHRWMWVYESKH